MPHVRSFLPVLFAAVVVVSAAARADEASVVRHLETALDAQGAERAKALEAAAADPDFDPGRLSDVLHQVGGLYDLPEGKKPVIEVPVGKGHVRQVMLRLPRGYTADKKWPLLYCLHSSGSAAPSILGHVENLLGKDADRFVLAAPHHYRQTSIDAPPPFTVDHPEMIRVLKTVVHVDSDRVYPIGYSLGGYTSWAIAILHADLIASAVPMAGAPVPMDVEGLWEEFGPNFRYAPVLSVWGQRDSLAVPGFEGRTHSIGSMSDLNRRFQPLIRKHGLNVIDHPVPRAGHGGARPDGQMLRDMLERERVHYPEEVRHRFRHIHQASAYWLEGHTWQGDAWNHINKRVKKNRGESWEKAYGRVYLPLLGLLEGTVDGNTLRVKTEHLSDFTVWLGADMVDWKKPIKVVHNGVKVFEGEVARDLGVAVAQAMRTRDFDRLRWAGIRVGKDGKGKVVTARS